MKRLKYRYFQDKSMRLILMSSRFENTGMRGKIWCPNFFRMVRALHRIVCFSLCCRICDRCAV